MKKAHIKGITNTENFIWYRIKADSLSGSYIDEIVKSLDEKFNEGIEFFQARSYKNFIPKRFSHTKDNEVYAISIFNEDLIDFILFKAHSSFKQIKSLIDHYFEI